jgi:hypothetical protein
LTRVPPWGATKDIVQGSFAYIPIGNKIFVNQLIFRPRINSLLSL